MKEYKRVTEKLKTMTKEYPILNCSVCPKNEECKNKTDYRDSCLRVAIDRLAELEDKIEQGTLIELPCKVGDKFYYVEKFWHNDWFEKGCFRWEILEYIITGVFIKGNSVVLYVNNDEDIYGREFTMYAKADGTFEFEELVEDYCFFTKAKAEKKLKGLKGEV